MYNINIVTNSARFGIERNILLATTFNKISCGSEARHNGCQWVYFLRDNARVERGEIRERDDTRIEREIARDLGQTHAQRVSSERSREIFAYRARDHERSSRIEREISIAFEWDFASRFSLGHSRNPLDSRSKKMYTFHCTVPVFVNIYNI